MVAISYVINMLWSIHGATSSETTTHETASGLKQEVHPDIEHAVSALAAFRAACREFDLEKQTKEIDSRVSEAIKNDWVEEKLERKMIFNRTSKDDIDSKIEDIGKFIGALCKVRCKDVVALLHMGSEGREVYGTLVNLYKYIKYLTQNHSHVLTEEYVNSLVIFEEEHRKGLIETNATLNHVFFSWVFGSWTDSSPVVENIFRILEMIANYKEIGPVERLQLLREVSDEYGEIFTNMYVSYLSYTPCLGVDDTELVASIEHCLSTFNTTAPICKKSITFEAIDMKMYSSNSMQIPQASVIRITEVLRAIGFENFIIKKDEFSMDITLGKTFMEDEVRFYSSLELADKTVLFSKLCSVFAYDKDISVTLGNTPCGRISLLILDAFVNRKIYRNLKNVSLYLYPPADTYREIIEYAVKNNVKLEIHVSGVHNLYYPERSIGIEPQLKKQFSEIGGRVLFNINDEGRPENYEKTPSETVVDYIPKLLENDAKGLRVRRVSFPISKSIAMQKFEELLFKKDLTSKDVAGFAYDSSDVFCVTNEGVEKLAKAGLRYLKLHLVFTPYYSFEESKEKNEEFGLRVISFNNVLFCDMIVNADEFNLLTSFGVKHAIFCNAKFTDKFFKSMTSINGERYRYLKSVEVICTHGKTAKNINWHSLDLKGLLSRFVKEDTTDMTQNPSTTECVKKECRCDEARELMMKHLHLSDAQQVNV